MRRCNTGAVYDSLERCRPLMSSERTWCRDGRGLYVHPDLHRVPVCRPGPLAWPDCDEGRPWHRRWTFVLGACEWPRRYLYPAVRVTF